MPTICRLVLRPFFVFFSVEVARTGESAAGECVGDVPGLLMASWGPELRHLRAERRHCCPVFAEVPKARSAPKFRTQNRTVASTGWATTLQAAGIIVHGSLVTKMRFRPILINC